MKLPSKKTLARRIILRQVSAIVTDAHNDRAAWLSERPDGTKVTDEELLVEMDNYAKKLAQRLFDEAQR